MRQRIADTLLVGTALLAVNFNSSAAADVLEHFRALSNADDFGNCNTLLVVRNVGGDERPEAFLSHTELRVGGVHIWHVYSPVTDGTRHLGGIDVHPRGFRVKDKEDGFHLYAGDTYRHFQIDRRGLHETGSTSLDTGNATALPHWLQSCDGDNVKWLGPDAPSVGGVDLSASVVDYARNFADAAAANDVATLDQLVATTVALHARDEAGDKALAAAAGAGAPEALIWLLQASTNYDFAALFAAARAAAANARVDLLLPLLDAAGERRAELAQAALGAAAQAGRREPLAVLLSAGGDANAATSEWEAQTPLELATASSQDGVIEALRSAGVDVTRADEVALFLAIDRGAGDEVAALLRTGVSPDAIHPGSTAAPAVTWAIYARQPVIAVQLLDAGADANLTAARGDTPIMEAAGHGYLTLVEKLLAAGADAAITNRPGFDALAAAVVPDNVDVVAALLATRPSAKSKNVALGLAAAAGADGVVCLLLEHSADPEWENALGRNARRQALMRQREATVRLLDDWQKACAAR